METDVVISDQHDEFGVSGVSEHPVEAAHVVLPVLPRERENNTNTAEAKFLYQDLNKENSPGRLMRLNGISEGHPAAPPPPPHGWLRPAALIQTPDLILHLRGPKAAHWRPLITSELWVFMTFTLMCLQMTPWCYFQLVLKQLVDRLSENGLWINNL